MRRLFSIVLIVGCLFAANRVHGQYMIGPKVVGMANYHFMYSKEHLLDISNRVNYGYAAGLSMTYTVTALFSVNIDALYANRGRTLKGGFRNEFSHIARYQFIDAPVMFRYKLGQTDKYSWYVTGGGNLSYFLSGKGVIKSFEYDESASPPFEYAIKRGDVTAIEDDNIVVANAHDIMVGLDIGVGFIFPMSKKQWLTVEIKYQHGHSWLGEDEGIDVGLIEYYEDFRTTTSSLTISAAYQFQRLIGESRKGRSTYGQKKKIK